MVVKRLIIPSSVQNATQVGIDVSIHHVHRRKTFYEQHTIKGTGPG